MVKYNIFDIIEEIFPEGMSEQSLQNRYNFILEKILNLCFELATEESKDLFEKYILYYYTISKVYFLNGNRKKKGHFDKIKSNLEILFKFYPELDYEDQ